jgi:hypothetical protein
VYHRRRAAEPELADEVAVEHVHEQLLQLLEALLHPHNTVKPQRSERARHDDFFFTGALLAYRWSLLAHHLGHLVEEVSHPRHLRREREGEKNTCK